MRVFSVFLDFKNDGNEQVADHCTIDDKKIRKTTK